MTRTLTIALYYILESIYGKWKLLKLLCKKPNSHSQSNKDIENCILAINIWKIPQTKIYLRDRINELSIILKWFISIHHFNKLFYEYMGWDSPMHFLFVFFTQRNVWNEIFYAWPFFKYIHTISTDHSCIQILFFVVFFF